MKEQLVNTLQLQIDPVSQFSFLLDNKSERSEILAKHKLWLAGIRRERPNTTRPYKVGIYIRFFNQTKHVHYLDLHKKQYADAISLCPMWTLVDYYVDEGPSAPFMENAPEWGRLLDDCMNDKIDLILTQKISNISRCIDEITICSRILAALSHPVGIYFISEDIFTLASYYQTDLHDLGFLPKTSLTPFALTENSND